jgi:hypothetical protein
LHVTHPEFARDVGALPLERPVPPDLVRTLSLLLEVLEGDDRFHGGCFNVTAIAHMLLTAQGIASTPCLGEVACKQGPFDHAWLEIEGAIYDLPIQYPMPGHPRQPMVIGGLHLGGGRLEGRPPSILYGVDPKSYGGGFDPNGDRAQVGPRTLPEYLDYVTSIYGSLWDAVRILGEQLGLTLLEEELRKTHAATRWVIKADKPVPKGMTREWLRLQAVT